MGSNWSTMGSKGEVEDEKPQHLKDKHAQVPLSHASPSPSAAMASPGLSGSTTAGRHQTTVLHPAELIPLPYGCPWRTTEIVRAVLRVTHDTQSPLHKLKAQHRLLELIIRRWVWPELFVNSLVAELVDANPGVTEAGLRRALELNPDGGIGSWDLSYCGLVTLPELFGAVHISRGSVYGGHATSGDLWLTGNRLRSLPACFGLITVGGNLYLSSNQLRSLPATFGSIIVGGDLWLNGNQLNSLPESFGSATVGGHLSLNSNQLCSLPASFGSVTVGGDLYLSNNQLCSLPATFGSTTVGVGGDFVVGSQSARE